MFSFFRRSKPRVVVLNRDSSNVTCDEYRANGDLVIAARKVINDPDFRLMLDAVRNTHVGKYDLPDNATIEQRAMVQAECQGFNLAIRMLLRLAVPPENPKQLVPTFEPPDYNTTE